MCVHGDRDRETDKDSVRSRDRVREIYCKILPRVTLEADKSSDVQSASRRPRRGTGALAVPGFSLSPKVGTDKSTFKGSLTGRIPSNLGASQQFVLIFLFWSLTDKMRFNHSREDQLPNQSM